VLYDFMQGATLDEHAVTQKTNGKRLTYRFRWFEGAPLRDGQDAMLVNWIGVTITDAKGRVTYEPLAKLWCGSAKFVASGDAASAILGDCSGSAWYSAASERFWVTSGKPMAALPRNGGKALMSCLGANALR
jgi:hypothetical protein